MSGQLLPVHGFVLAGGKSSRMGTDKALLKFCGKPLVEIAVAKLREFCAEVSIVGNRDDLAGFARVVREARLDVGPGAGIEAGLEAATQRWCLFVPVDVPLVPAELLRRWADSVLGFEGVGLGVSLLLANREMQPAFCMVRRDCGPRVSVALESGERRLSEVLGAIDRADGDSWEQVADIAKFATSPPTEVQVRFWFANLNTPLEFDEAEAWAETLRG